ncbi:MAG: hypothetical protein PUG36_00130 [Clostridiales bacterium]|nr:hypothetical protein [Clostridiales bacterium]
MAELIGVNEVVSIVGTGPDAAYKIIRDLNAELKEQGFLTVRGRISESYLRERLRLSGVRECQTES